MAISHKNGVALSGLSAVNGVTSISALNGQSATLGGGGGSPAFVGEIATRVSSTASASTTVMTVNTTVPVGQRVVVIVSTVSSSQTADSMTDSKGNTYARDVNSLGGSDVRKVIFSSLISTQLVSSDTITVTWGSPGFTFRGMAGFALENVDTNTPDVTAESHQTSTTSPSCPGTTVTANTVAIGQLRTDNTRTYTSTWQIIGAAHDFGGANRAYYFYEEFASAGSKDPAGTIAASAGQGSSAWAAYKD